MELMRPPKRARTHHEGRERAASAPILMSVFSDRQRWPGAIFFDRVYQWIAAHGVSIHLSSDLLRYFRQALWSLQKGFVTDSSFYVALMATCKHVLKQGPPTGLGTTPQGKALIDRRYTRLFDGSRSCNSLALYILLDDMDGGEAFESAIRQYMSLEFRVRSDHKATCPVGEAIARFAEYLNTDIMPKLCDFSKTPDACHYYEPPMPVPTTPSVPAIGPKGKKILDITSMCADGVPFDKTIEVIMESRGPRVPPVLVLSLFNLVGQRPIDMPLKVDPVIVNLLFHVLVANPDLWVDADSPEMVVFTIFMFLLFHVTMVSNIVWKTSGTKDAKLANIIDELKKLCNGSLTETRRRWGDILRMNLHNKLATGVPVFGVWHEAPQLYEAAIRRALSLAVFIRYTMRLTSNAGGRIMWWEAYHISGLLNFSMDLSLFMNCGIYDRLINKTQSTTKEPRVDLTALAEYKEYVPKGRFDKDKMSLSDALIVSAKHPQLEVALEYIYWTVGRSEDTARDILKMLFNVQRFDAVSLRMAAATSDSTPHTPADSFFLKRF